MEITTSNNKVVPKFKWKDKEDKFHSIKDMSTQHLFFIIRMIWNHTAPIDMRIEPYTKYTFSSFYTLEYIKTALKEIYQELNKRDDLTPYYIKCLLHIEKCLYKNNKLNERN